MYKFKPGDLVKCDLFNIPEYYRIESAGGGFYSGLVTDALGNSNGDRFTSPADTFDKGATLMPAFGDWVPQLKKFCTHNWVDYIGFTEAYCFCTLCDSRKSLQ